VRLLESAWLPAGRAPERSIESRQVIDYALSYGTVLVPDILYDKQYDRKTVAPGPIVKVASNTGAPTRV
jgi:hypothetical protein